MGASDSTVSSLAQRLGERLAFEVQGQGPAVVFLHGFAGSRRQWRTLMDPVASWGYRTYALDLPGHGESPKPREREAYHPRVWVDALAAWHQRYVGEPAWWVGHSLGGGMAVLLARRHPQRVRGGLLVAPYLHRRQWRGWVHLLAPFMPLLAQPLGYPHWASPAMHLAWCIHPDYHQAPPTQRRVRVWEALHLSPRAWWTVLHMAAPWTPPPPGRWALIAGTRDTILRYASFVDLARAWNLPLQTLPEGRHILHISHPQEVLAVLEALLTEAALQTATDSRTVSPLTP